MDEREQYMLNEINRLYTDEEFFRIILYTFMSYLFCTMANNVTEIFIEKLFKVYKSMDEFPEEITELVKLKNIN